MQQSDIIALATILCAVAILMMKICFASKCNKIELCYGLVHIDRNTSQESKEFHNGSPSPASFRRIDNSLNIEAVADKLAERKESVL